MARLGVSIREFARLDGCSDMAVRKAIASGAIKTLADGSMDPALVGSGWRKKNRDGSRVAMEVRADETPAEAAERIVVEEGHAPHSLAEAERIKENYLAKLRQLEYDIKAGEVVRVADVMRIVASQYGIIRNRMRSLSAEIAPRLSVMNSAPEIQAFHAAETEKAIEALTLDLAKDADEFRRALR